MKSSLSKGLFKKLSHILFLCCISALTFSLVSCPDTECDECPDCGGELECIDFENPTLGATYSVPDIIKDSGFNIHVEPFQWENGTWTLGNGVTIQANGEAGGTGQEAWLDNVNILIELCEPVEGLTVKYKDNGGNMNLTVNGCLENFTDMTALPPTICGIAVSVSSSGNTGILTLCGSIETFSIGGQEFIIDDICFGPCD